MRIETKTTLIFTITSDNPPHTTAVDFIKSAAKQWNTECEHSALPMREGETHNRSTEFRLTDGDADNLSSFAHQIRGAMNLIGVAMSEAE